MRDGTDAELVESALHSLLRYGMAAGEVIQDGIHGQNVPATKTHQALRAIRKDGDAAAQ